MSISFRERDDSGAVTPISDMLRMSPRNFPSRSPDVNHATNHQRTSPVLSAYRSSSPAGSMMSQSSSRSYRIATESQGEREMTEDEVSELVSKALRRARKATTPRFSPRPMSSPSNIPGVDMVSEMSTPSEHSEAKTPSTIGFMVGIHSGVDGSPGSHDEVTSKLSDTQLFSRSYDQWTDTGADVLRSVHSTPKSDGTNSSDDILKKVEQEIAIAQNAAVDATERLNLALSMPATSDSFDNVNKSPTQELDDILDDDLKDILSVSDSEAGRDEDEEDRFEDARGDDEDFGNHSVSIGYAPPVDGENLRLDSTPVQSQSRDEVVGDESRFVSREYDSRRDSSESDYTEETVDDDDEDNNRSNMIEREIVLSDPETGNVDGEDESEYTEEEIDEDESDFTEETVDDDDDASEDGRMSKSVGKSALNEKQLIDLMADRAEEGVEVAELREDEPPLPSDKGSSAEEGQEDDGRTTVEAKEVVDSGSKEYVSLNAGVDAISTENGSHHHETEGKPLRSIPPTSQRINMVDKRPSPYASGPPAIQESPSPWLTDPELEEEEEIPDDERAVDAHNDAASNQMDGGSVYDERGTPEQGERQRQSVLSQAPLIPVNRTDGVISQKTGGGSYFVPAPAPAPAPIMARWERSASPTIMRVSQNANSHGPDPLGDENRKENVASVLSDNNQIEFRNPYPLPPPIPRPRAAVEIINDNEAGLPEPCTRFSKPNIELEKLLMAVTGLSLPRRSNACGALKVLSLKSKNQVMLVRTEGFLDALVFAIKEDIPKTKDKDIGLDARGRAVSTLLNVSERKENRKYVMAHPGVGEALKKVIGDDQGEARVHAVAVLAMLAKTPPNREFMVKIPGLLELLARVLSGEIDRNRRQNDDKKQHERPEDDDVAVVPLNGDGFGSSSFSTDNSGGIYEEQENISFDAVSASSNTNTKPPLGPGKSLSTSIKQQKSEKYSEFLTKSRVNSCAVLSHLSKHCSISDSLADNDVLVGSIVRVCREFDNPVHTKCIEIICNLSRFPSNNAGMARNEALVETMVKCGKSKKLSDRIWALRTFQNLASDPTSKVILANGRILTLLSICSMRKDYDEQIAAVAALYNLSTEPGAVVPLTNTKNVVATLVHLAHNAISTPELRQMACDALATIGLWLQTLAGSGTVPDGVTKVLLPSHQTSGWERWE